MRAMIVEALCEFGLSMREVEGGQSSLCGVSSCEPLDLLMVTIGLNGHQLADVAPQGNLGLPILLVSDLPYAVFDDTKVARRFDIVRAPFSLDALTSRSHARISLSERINGGMPAGS